MARIRSVKPDFFTSEDVAVLPLRARMTWIGVWTHADDHGRAKDNARLVKAAVWPLDDVTVDEVEYDLEVLAEHGRIVRYSVDGKRYLAIANWHHHQAVNRPSSSKIPAPPTPISVPAPGVGGHCAGCWADLVHTQAVVAEPPASNPVDNTVDAGHSAQGGLSEFSVSHHAPLTPGKEGKGTEGEGSEAPPTPHCPIHKGDGSDPPCRACATRRQAFERWKAQEPLRQAQARSAEAHRAAAARAAAVRACSMCDDRGYAGLALCDHDPTRADTAARGIAKVRAALPRNNDRRVEIPA